MCGKANEKAFVGYHSRRSKSRIQQEEDDLSEAAMRVRLVQIQMRFMEKHFVTISACDAHGPSKTSLEDKTKNPRFNAIILHPIFPSNQECFRPLSLSLSFLNDVQKKKEENEPDE